MIRHQARRHHSDAEWWANKPSKWRGRYSLPFIWQLVILIVGGLLVGAATAWKGP